uniref:Uncharacterized protein n=1 Tax=Arundo donax TaxID=35708 RepID=A0A0A9BPK1_ARUDO
MDSRTDATVALVVEDATASSTDQPQAEPPRLRAANAGLCSSACCSARPQACSPPAAAPSAGLGIFRRLHGGRGARVVRQAAAPRLRGEAKLAARLLASVVVGVLRPYGFYVPCGLFIFSYIYTALSVLLYKDPKIESEKLLTQERLYVLLNKVTHLRRPEQHNIKQQHMHEIFSLFTAKLQSIASQKSQSTQRKFALNRKKCTAHQKKHSSRKLKIQTIN